MSSLTKEEYLALIKELLEQQYIEDNDTSIESENCWIPAEPAVKDKLPFSVSGGAIDLSKDKKEKVRILMFQSNIFKVDHFLIKVKSPVAAKLADRTPSLTIELYEEKFQTPSGAPCRMEYKMNIPKDSRFNDFAHTSKFTHGGCAIGVTEEVFIDLIRWLQAIKRMTAFL